MFFFKKENVLCYNIFRSNCDAAIRQELRTHYHTPYFLPNQSETSEQDWIFMGGPGPGAQIHVSHFIKKRTKQNNEPCCWHSESLLAKNEANKTKSGMSRRFLVFGCVQLAGRELEQK